MINNISFVCNSEGKNCRELKNEGIQSFFTMSKEPTSDKKIRQITDDEKKYFLELKPEDITLSLIKELFTISEHRKEKKFEFEDQIILKPNEFYNDKEIVTTVGRFLINKFIFKPNVIKLVKYKNDIFNADYIHDLDNEILSLVIDEKLVLDDFYDYINRFTWLGYAPTIYINPSLNLDIYTIDDKIKKLKAKLIKENQEGFNNNNLAVVESVEKQLLDASKEIVKNSNGYQIYQSGARGSFENNYKNTCVMRGSVVDFGNLGKYKNATSSLVEGVKKEDFPITANIAYAGSYGRAKQTVFGGYLAKKSRAGLQCIQLDEKGSDCHSKHYNTITITKFNSKLFIYRYILDEKTNKEILLTPNIIKDYIGKTVKMRSPMYCVGDKICNHCAGDLYYRLGMLNIGILFDNVCGIIMNKSMKSFHDATIKLTNIDILSFIKKVQ